MQTTRNVLEVIFKETWRIALEGKEFGPYPSEQEAVEAARAWADDAEAQGQHLSVVIRGGHPNYEVFGQ